MGAVRDHHGRWVRSNGSRFKCRIRYGRDRDQNITKLDGVLALRAWLTLPSRLTPGHPGAAEQLRNFVPRLLRLGLWAHDPPKATHFHHTALCCAPATRRDRGAALPPESRRFPDPTLCPPSMAPMFRAPLGTGGLQFVHVLPVHSTLYPGQRFFIGGSGPECEPASSPSLLCAPARQSRTWAMAAGSLAPRLSTAHCRAGSTARPGLCRWDGDILCHRWDGCWSACRAPLPNAVGRSRRCARLVQPRILGLPARESCGPRPKSCISRPESSLLDAGNLLVDPEVGRPRAPSHRLRVNRKPRLVGERARGPTAIRGQ